jgi:hypothetical protein
MKASPALFVASVLFLPAAAAVPLAMQRGPGVAWVCAGVGADERRELEALRGESNLEVVVVTAKRGGYLAGAKVALYREKSAAPLLETVADGPVCLARLAPGDYRVEAALEGVRRVLRASVPQKGRARVVVPFPDEAWDGIKASDDEKRQAAS